VNLNLFATQTAAQGYARARDAAAPAAADGAAADFGGLAGLAQGFADTLARTDATAKAAMAGKADPHALVEALASSSFAVEAAVTVRDRVVEAYQEILRMPV
jgi:flagellar hook-basal body complex protein FliE